MENNKNDAPSTSGATSTSAKDKEEDEELNQILEDLVFFELENNEAVGEAAGYNKDDTMACLRNEFYSVEQIAVLMDIWATKFENNVQRTPEQQAFRNACLKQLVESTHPQKLLGGTVEESVKNLNNMLLAVRDCGLCKLMVYTKECILHCTNHMICNWYSPIKCSVFKDTGLSYLALKELKEEIEELHKQRCSCLHCASFLPKYDELACKLSLHEQIHISRRDIGFSK